MAGVFVIIASVTGFVSSLLLWLAGCGFMTATLSGYGLSALLFGVLVLREGRGMLTSDDFRIVEEEQHREQSLGAPLRS